MCFTVIDDAPIMTGGVTGASDVMGGIMGVSDMMGGITGGVPIT